MNKYAQFDDEFIKSFGDWVFPDELYYYLHKCDSPEDFDIAWQEFLGNIRWVDLHDDRHIASLTGALPWEL